MRRLGRAMRPDDYNKIYDILEETPKENIPALRRREDQLTDIVYQLMHEVERLEKALQREGSLAFPRST